MKRKIRFPVAAKVVAVVIGIMIIVGGITAASVIGEERETLTRQIELRGLTMVRSLQAATAPLILDRNEPEIEATVAQIAREETVILAAISNKKGRIVSHSDMILRGKQTGEVGLPTDTPEDPSMQETAWNGKPVFLFVSPVRFAGHTLGTAYVGLSQSVLTDALASVRRRILLITSLGVLFGSLAVIGVIGFILRPIRRLEEAAAQFATGNLGFRAAVSSRDEIGGLSDTLNDMAAQLAVAQEAMAKVQLLAQEAQDAARVQRAMLPRHVPKHPVFAIAANQEPAKEVGGDYYDFFELPGNRLGMVVADVSGKGFSAALIVAQLRSAFAIAALTESGPRQTLIRVNQLLTPDMAKGKFVAAIYVVANPEERSITFASAGHPPLLLMQQGQVQALKGKGKAIGLDSSHRFGDELEEKMMELQPGSTVYLYTDGITEQPNINQEEFGDQRLIDFLVNLGELSPDEMLDRINNNLKQFRGSVPPADDVTHVACRVL